MFQKSVLKKHIRSLDKFLLNSAYDKFLKIFSRKRINEIVKLKEEEYAEGFLRDLFVKVLGYKLKPDENFNLVREMKNPTNSKKTDAAILKNGNAIAVIELKSTKTKDLTKVTEQAFNYKNNHPFCKYVITSNFQKLRFYVEHSNEYQEFNLFACKKTDFELLYLILNKENIFIDIPQKLKEETKFHEEKISKKFYKDYSNLKNEIFENLILRNKKIDKLTLFKKSQKLLNRLIFIFFAEDYGLMPPNSIFEIIDKYKKLIQLDEYKKLYEIYKEYFNYINAGREGKFYANNIPAYNGGLFAKDKILDNLKIDDKILKNEVLKLASYDFSTELDVNILGHIFEHSLNEIEEMEKKINLQGFKNLEGLKTSKRKKDGVFYTPKYITQYIVENTIGTLCTEKRKEMNIYEIEFDNSYNTKRGRLNKKGKALFITFNNYKKWLESLKILDPACGSGAFLNQALQFLIKEHKFIDDLTAELTKQKIRLFDIDKNILENNLFGVDINEESVDIAKLSLWLRTAQKGRKLSTLNENIKCGNSLIDDPKIAGNKAFDWNLEFKEIMDNGGFDVVIGNPPYVAIQGIKWNERRHLETVYKTAIGRFDLYTLFIEKALQIKKQFSYFSFIVPGKFLNNKQFKQTRKILCENHSVEVLKIDDKVFNEAQVDSVILLNYGKNINEYNKYKSFQLSEGKLELLSETSIENILSEEQYTFRLEISDNFDYLIKKIEENSILVSQIAEVKDGIVAGVIKDILFINDKINDNCEKLYFGKHISKYYLNNTDVWVNYMPNEMMREEKKRKRDKRIGLWMRDKKIFEREKIIYRKVGKELIATFAQKGIYYEQTAHSCHVTNKKFHHKYILCIFNSNLFKFYYHKTNSQGGNIFPQLRISSIKKLPIKQINIVEQNKFIEKADLMLFLNKVFQTDKDNFLQTLREEKSLLKLSRKLQNFHNMEFDEFKKELRKKKVKFSLGTENNEWREYFEKTKEKINHLQIQIDKTDKIIDKMVYELYKLNEEEIKIICEN